MIWINCAIRWGVSSLHIPVHVVGFACVLKTSEGCTVFWHWGTSKIKSYDNHIFHVKYLIAAGALYDREYGKATWTYSYASDFMTAMKLLLLSAPYGGSRHIK